MGEVYRARDTRLGRIVAIKVLKPEVQAESERLRREAKAISRLAYANICGLFDVGSEGELDFLVMEYLEGESLEDRLKSGSLDRVEFFRYAIAIAGALDHAHRNGVVHRDLKPSNLVITRAGEIKLLDFGLAALRRPVTAAVETTLTIEKDLTKSGTVMGTPRYMSPEQLLGKESDARSDIFAFGAVLFEMATGRKAFGGKEWSEISAAILSGPYPSLGPAADPALDHLIGRCLAKNPDDRWQTARDLKSELEWLAARPAQNLARPAPLRSLPWIAALLLAGVLLVVSGRRWLAPESKPPRVVRLAIAIPEEGAVADPGRLNGSPAISPDGKTVVVPLGEGSAAALWLRRLDSDRFDRLPGTEGGTQPFWSPDGSQIGFFAAGKLKKMPLDGGAPQVLCPVSSGAGPRGGAWNSSGTILFGINYEGLRRISERGGDSVLVAGLDQKVGENSLRYPQFLPDGNRFIYFSRTARLEDAAIYLDALDTVGKRPRKRIAVTEGPAFLGHDPFSGQYYLLFPKAARLWAQHFDLDRGEVGGEAIAISEDVGQFSLSVTGTLVFRRLTSETNKLTWFDRTGKPMGDAGQKGDFWEVALSPDERHAAVVDHRSVDGHFWISLIDLARNLQTPFSDPVEFSYSPVWSGDSNRVYFFSPRGGKQQLFAKSFDEAGADQALITLTEVMRPRDVSPDGKILLAERWRNSANERVLGVMTIGQNDWRPLLETKARTERGQFSPDGRTVAYQSDESGVNEIYITDFPAARHKQRISTAGGTEPRWGHNGKELFYLAPDGTLMSVANADQARPTALFKAQARTQSDAFRYAVARDGRFLIINGTVDPRSRDLSIIFNWPQLLREK